MCNLCTAYNYGIACNLEQFIIVLAIFGLKFDRFTLVFYLLTERLPDWLWVFKNSSEVIGVQRFGLCCHIKLKFSLQWLKQTREGWHISAPVHLKHDSWSDLVQWRIKSKKHFFTMHRTAFSPKKKHTKTKQITIWEKKNVI